MKRHNFSLVAVALLFLVTGSRLAAQIPSGYYNNANGKTGDELKVALHDIIKGHTSISYANIWTAFWSTDNKGNNVVWDMYSDGANYTYNYNSNDQCGEYVQEGDCYNREHSWPQSWFSGNDQAIPSRDLHHVFPTDGFVNSQRSNFPFGEVSTASWTSQNGSKLGSCKTSLGYSGTVFEPIDEYKGDFARALLYMSVRYYGEDSDWSTSGMTDKSNIKDWAISMLLNWNDNDPVSQKEIDRNNAVYGIQGNRNPFIDNSEYARMIWDPNWTGSIGGYVKVTSSEEITDGDYLIVYENGNLAFDGSLPNLDVTGNNIAVTISGSTIESNAETDAAAFTIAAKTGGYSIKSASGYYIGQTSNANGLFSSTTTAYTNTISVNEGNVDIISSGGAYLRYNASSGQERFRYYKSSSYTGQQAIQLYKKIAVYSITLASVEHGSISADVEGAVEGTTIILTATPEEGYELDYWNVTDAQGNLITVTENQFEMPASNVTVSAAFVYVGVFEQKYYLVTDASQLVAGRTYLIVNTEYGKALGKTQNTNNRSAASVTITSNSISILGDACELTLGGQAGAWTFYDATNNSGYLYAAGGSSNNYLRTQTTLTNAGKWTISLNGNNMATIKTIDSNVNRHTIMYNNSGNLFSCYASGQKEVCLFIRSEQYEHEENTTLACFNTFDKHTVHSGVTLTANTVLGTNMCNNPTYLVIEDGAQFIHNVDGVQATMKKNISAYTADGGWNTIAVPFASFNPAGTMLADNYDLYAYHESDDLEWYNYKAHSTDFVMASGLGYLYAHNPDVTLRMSGTLNRGDHSQTVELSYGNSAESIKGFNLLGNPTAHDITFAKSGQVSDGYYYLSNSSNWEYETGNTVPVGRGFLVKTNAEGQTVTLNQQNRGGGRDEGQFLCLSIGKEKVYVKLDEGVSMPRLDMMDRHSNLYLTRDGKPYTMLVRDAANTIDLNFEVRNEGGHILKADSEGLALGYLHLIDHKTGADIDLLATPEYAFEAHVGDYASRFQLVFSVSPSTGLGASDNDAPFAYIQNEGIVVVADALDASLQVIDMYGRVLVCKDMRHASAISTANIPAGVYVLRLIASDSVRTQKIVIQ